MRTLARARARTNASWSVVDGKPAAFVARNISPLMSAIVLAGQASRQYVNGLTPPQYGNNRASSFSSSSQALEYVDAGRTHRARRSDSACAHVRTYADLSTTCPARRMCTHTPTDSWHSRPREQTRKSLTQRASHVFRLSSPPRFSFPRRSQAPGNILSVLLNEVKVRLRAADNISAV